MEVLVNQFSFILIIVQIGYLVFAILLLWLLIKLIQFFTLKNRELMKKINKE